MSRAFSAAVIVPQHILSIGSRSRFLRRQMGRKTKRHTSAILAISIELFKFRRYSLELKYFTK